MSAKEMNVGNIGAALGNGLNATIIFNADKGYNLVERALGVKLNLAVLVGYAKRLNGSLPRERFVAVFIHLFTEALAPKLAVPVGYIFKAVGIRHHNRNIFALVHSHIL